MAAADILDNSKVIADPVDIAVVWVEKAQSMSSQWTDSCSKEQIVAYRLRKRMKPVTTFVKYLLLLLAAFERPSYCLLDEVKCPGSDRPDMSASGMWEQPAAESNAIMICVYLYFIWNVYLRKQALGAGHNFHGWHMLGTWLVALALCDCLVSFFTTTGLVWWSSFRISRLFRPFIFLSFTKSLREEAVRVVRSVPGFLDVFIALIVAIVFFTWVGIVIFNGSAEGAGFFSTWSQAMSNLWVLFTTANCPDVFVVAYDKHRISFLFFLIFLIVTVYLLSNLLLAQVYDSYKSQLVDMVRDHYKSRKDAIQHAFALLANGRGVIQRPRFAQFFVSLCRSSLGGEDSLEQSDDENYNKSRAMQMFDAMDIDHGGGLDETEFKAILDVIHNSQIHIPRQSPPHINKSPWVKSLKALFTEGVHFGDVHLISWDGFVDCVILIDVMAVFCQTVVFHSNSYQSVLETFSLFAFSCFYAVTLSLKIYIFGFERFWYFNPLQNRFDFFSISGVCVAEIASLTLAFHFEGETPSWVPKTVVLLHITRSLRILHYVQPLKFIARLLLRLAPTYYRTGMLLFLLFYLYATIGQQVFGDVMYKSHPALKGSDYAAANYWAFNFSDFTSSMVTLFVLMVGNNWFVFADAYIKASGTRFAAIFFVSFSIFVNLIVLNVLMAMILDCSGVVAKELEEDVEDESLEEGQQSLKAKKDYNYEAVLKSVLLTDEDLEDKLQPSFARPKNAASSQPLLTGSRSSPALYGAVGPHIGSSADISS